MTCSNFSCSECCLGACAGFVLTAAAAMLAFFTGAYLQPESAAARAVASLLEPHCIAFGIALCFAAVALLFAAASIVRCFPEEQPAQEPKMLSPPAAPMHASARDAPASRPHASSASPAATSAPAERVSPEHRAAASSAPDASSASAAVPPVHTCTRHKGAESAAAPSSGAAPQFQLFADGSARPTMAYHIIHRRTDDATVSELVFEVRWPEHLSSCCLRISG